MTGKRRGSHANCPVAANLIELSERGSRPVLREEGLPAKKVSPIRAPGGFELGCVFLGDIPVSGLTGLFAASESEFRPRHSIPPGTNGEDHHCENGYGYPFSARWNPRGGQCIAGNCRRIHGRLETDLSEIARSLSNPASYRQGFDLMSIRTGWLSGGTFAVNGVVVTEA